MTIQSKIVAVGGYLPSRIITNEQMSEIVDTSDEWITDRTGIKERHIAGETETTSDLGAYALLNCAKNYNFNLNNLDGIIVATSTPDFVFPSVAALIQKKAGITNNCFAFDLNAVCTGFVYALSVADAMIKSGYKSIAVIGAETMSRIIDWNDRSTCVLFGDGAGAIILNAKENNGSGIIDCLLNADNSCGEILWVPGGISSGNLDSTLKMNGREVFKFAVNKGIECITKLLKRNNISINDIDFLIAHQANQRIIQAITERISMPLEKAVITIDKHANTSAASIPLALDQLVGKNLSSYKGKKAILLGFGGGMTWGGLLITL